MKKLLFIFALLVFAVALTSCASPYVNTYRAGAVLKEVATESHKQAWSEPLRAQAETCDVPANDTVAKLDECMDPYTLDANHKVVQALTVYKAAAEALTTAMVATDADKNPEAMKAAFNQALEALRTLVALYPAAGVWLDRIDMLLKGFGR